MSVDKYPRDRVEAQLRRVTIANAQRIVWRTAFNEPLRCRPAPSRFCDGRSGYAILYAAPKFETAFIETLVRDRFVHRVDRQIPYSDVSSRCWAELATRSVPEMNLIDLTGSGCLMLGAPTDAARARNHTAGRALGRAIYQQHADVDGFLYDSRFLKETCFAIFDRAVGKLSLLKHGELQDHPELPAVLDQYEITLEKD